MRRLIFVLVLLLWPGAALADPKVDAAPRVAVMTAMPTEMAALRAAASEAVEHKVGGVVFITARLEGRPVVLFMSGVSMTNAAMTTQLALERFNITAIVFSGVAGGLDPALAVGDVAVPAQWGSYMETRFLKAGPDGAFIPPANGSWGADLAFAPYGMIWPHGQVVATPAGPEARFWFPADGGLLEVARRTAADVTLKRCTAAGQCLARQPRIVVGGNGLSASVFMDNAAFRDYLFGTFHAQAVDMETAAVAQVAYVWGVKFIAFRSLSDLAGADEGANPFSQFVMLAAENAAVTLRQFLKEMPA